MGLIFAFFVALLAILGVVLLVIGAIPTTRMYLMDQPNQPLMKVGIILLGAMFVVMAGGFILLGSAMGILFLPTILGNQASQQSLPALVAPFMPTSISGPDAVPTTTSCGPAFGGPYEYKAGPGKIAEFEEMKKKKYFFSHGRRLTMELLGKSVGRDKKSAEGAIPGRKFLKYNYAIDAQDCKIYVAVWDIDASDRDPDGPNFKVFLPTEEDPQEVRCTNTSTGAWVPRKGAMIDFYQEEPLPWATPQINKQSPCWLQLASLDGSKGLGILDAMSKHFMLAQPHYRKWIRGMDPSDGSMTNVAYAGEIVVDILSCEYEINGNSGTYRPTATLDKVKEYFADRLAIQPSGPIPGCSPSVP